MSQFSSRQRNALAIILASYLLILLDTSIVITGLPEIQASLGFSQVGLSWVQNAYTLAFGSLLLLGARAGDLFGRKNVFMWAIACFALASFVIGLTQSTSLMIAARAAQGASAAVLAPATLSLLSTYFSEGEERVRALSLYGATAGIGATLGLVLGGMFAGWLSWRVGFFVNIPVCVVLFFAARFLLEESDPESGKLDVMGAIYSTFGMACLIYGIIEGGELGWQQTIPWGFLGMALLSLMIFVANEARHQAPLMPLRLFSDFERTSAYLARMTFVGAMVSFFFFSTQFMQHVLNYSPVEAGLGFVPMTAFTFISAMWVPKVTRIIGNKWVVMGAFALLILGLWLLSNLNAGAEYLADLLLPMIIIGLGNGAALGPLTVSGVKGVAAKDAGAASGVVNTAHQLGGTIGLSVLVVIFASAKDPSLDPTSAWAGQISVGYLGCVVMLVVGLLILLASALNSNMRQRKMASV